MSSILYKLPCAILLGVEDDYPQYGKVVEIIVVNCSCVMFNVCVMKIVSFSSHYSTYCLSPLPVTRIIPLSKLHSPFPVHMYHVLCSGVIQPLVVPKCILLVACTKQFFILYYAVCTRAEYNKLTA